jgi:hypothetical protein
MFVVLADTGTYLFSLMPRHSGLFFMVRWFLIGLLFCAHSGQVFADIELLNRVVQIEPLAIRGTTAPGAEGATYTNVLWSHSSSDGRFTWLDTLSSGEDGLWVNDGLGTRLVTMTGDSSPYSEFFAQGSGFINSNGEITLVTIKDDDEEVFVIGNGPDRVVVLPNQPAPGLPGLTMKHTSRGVEITDASVISLLRDLSGPGVDSTNNLAHWVGPPDDYQLLIRRGDPAPGLPGRFVGGLARGFAINDSGFTIIEDQVDGVGGVFWSGVPGDLKLVAAENTPAPGTTGLNYGSFIPSFVRVAEDNDVVFVTGLTDPITNQKAGDGLWFGTRDAPQLVFGPSTPSPLGDGSLFTEIGNLQINNVENAVLTATLTSVSGHDQSVLLQTDLKNPLDTSVVASVGDIAPGGTEAFTKLGGPEINERGDVLFWGKLDGLGPANFGHGLWIKPAGQQLQLLARKGQWIDVLPGPDEDLRQIDFVGLQTPLTEPGSIAMLITFVGNTGGLFVARLAEVPEPSTLLLANIAGVLIGSGRRRV